MRIEFNPAKWHLNRWLTVIFALLRGPIFAECMQASGACATQTQCVFSHDVKAPE